MLIQILFTPAEAENSPLSGTAGDRKSGADSVVLLCFSEMPLVVFASGDEKHIQQRRCIVFKTHKCRLD